MAFVFDPQSARLIAPWKKGPLHLLDEARLLSVLARCDVLAVDGPVRIWSDPYREPVPVQNADPRWLAKLGGGIGRATRRADALDNTYSWSRSSSLAVIALRMR